jgi:hypothetical protein
VSPAVRYTLLALAAAALAFGITHLCLRPSATAAANPDEIAWLRAEFNLTPVQVAAIEKLHADYHPVCMTHCAAITEAREQSAPPAELARLEAVCRDATLAHLQRVAAVMSPAEAARFLALVEPKVSGHSHATPLGLK